MRAVTWQGHRDIRVETVPDPTIVEPTDAVIRITSTALCGSDLHLYEVLTMFLEPGDILGHEPMGIVEAVGSAVTHIAPGDRVVVPFNISCGSCFMCSRSLHSQCETTQVTAQDKGAALFGYTKLYGQVPGGQAEYLRVPQAHFGPIKVPDDGTPDERWLFLSDVLPTAWQAVVYAAVPPNGTVAVFGLGPIGQMAARIARHRGAGQVLGIDRVPERLSMAHRHGIIPIDATDGNVVAQLREYTAGRGPDSVIDAVGMEAHGNLMAATVQRAAGLLPQKVSAALTERIGIDRLGVLHDAIDAVRRGGTVSISGVYGGMVDPMPMMTLFDKQVQLRMGQANVHAWVNQILPLLSDGADPLGIDDLVTHRLPLEQAADAYRMFQRKDDGAIKVVFDPSARPTPPPAPTEQGSALSVPA